jgi:hypothetical protein
MATIDHDWIVRQDQVLGGWGVFDSNSSDRGDGDLWHARQLSYNQACETLEILLAKPHLQPVGIAARINPPVSILQKLSTARLGEMAVDPFGSPGACGFPLQLILNELHDRALVDYMQSVDDYTSYARNTSAKTLGEHLAEGGPGMASQIFLDELHGRALAGLDLPADEDDDNQCPGHYDDDHTLMSGVATGEPSYCDGTCQ